MTSVTFLILRATGNLSKRKLIPAIYNLILKKRIKDFAVIGISKDSMDAGKLVDESKKCIKNIDAKAWDTLKKRFYYFKTDFYDEKKFCGIGLFVREIEKKRKLAGNRIFYLATLPQHFEVISSALDNCGLAMQKGNWTRVVFEKPFGYDLKSAREINSCISKLFDESQVYRIDHYLGKELVQNISVARFTNTILEPLWSRKYIDHVQIVLSEDAGIGERGPFYDSYGAVRDVVQNHMMQMLSLAAMESPKKLTAKLIRDEKVKVLKSVKVTDEITVGQYAGYRNEKGVKHNSGTETFAALKLFIGNSRWKGVPFYLITGKRMKDKITSIYIQFRQAPCLMFRGICNFQPNYLVIQVQPEEGFYLQMNAKVPGRMDIAPIRLDFCHECTFGPNTPEAYENLLLDVIKGDQSVFARSDEIEQGWRIADEISKKKKKVYDYKKGAYPESAKKLIEKDRRHWHLKVK